MIASRDTTRIGDVAEWQIVAALIRSGRNVLRPLSAASRYDLLIDNEDGTFARVQCKSGVLKNGCVVFRLYSVSGHTTASHLYAGQIDAFGVYCGELNATYLIPASSLGAETMAALRVAPARNGQLKHVRAADAFRI